MNRLYAAAGSPLPHEPCPLGPPSDVEAYCATTSPVKGLNILPRDIANAVLFLASDMGRCVNVRRPLHLQPMDPRAAACSSGLLGRRVKVQFRRSWLLERASPLQVPTP